jgi:rod shape-determining protein MreD
MVVFHTTIAPGSVFFSGTYDLLVTFVIYLGFYRKIRDGIGFVFFSGLLMDVYTGGIFGIYMTAYFWLYVVVVGLTLFMRTNNIMLLPPVVFFGVIFENFVLIGVTILIDPEVSIPSSALRIFAGQAIWAFFTGPLLILAFKLVDKKWNKYVDSRDKEYA